MRPVTGRTLLGRHAVIGRGIADRSAGAVVRADALHAPSAERLAVGRGGMAVPVHLTGHAQPQVTTDGAGHPPAAAALGKIVAALDADAGVVVLAIRRGRGARGVRALPVTEGDAVMGPAAPALAAIAVRPALDAAVGRRVATDARRPERGALVIVGAFDAGGGRGIAVQGGKPALGVVIAAALIERDVPVTGQQPDREHDERARSARENHRPRPRPRARHGPIPASRRASSRANPSG